MPLVAIFAAPHPPLIMVRRLLTCRARSRRYCAPEVLDGGRYACSCDVYSFGICLLEIAAICVGARRDFVKKQIRSHVFIANGGRPRMPHTLEKQAPNICSVIRMCWHGDPASRPNFRELLEVIEGWAGELAPTS